jgi:hypothetical protein
MYWKRFKRTCDGQTFIECEDKDIAIVYTKIIDGSVYLGDVVVASLNMSTNVIGDEVYNFPEKRLR